MRAAPGPAPLSPRPGAVSVAGRPRTADVRSEFETLLDEAEERLAALCDRLEAGELVEDGETREVDVILRRARRLAMLIYGPSC